MTFWSASEAQRHAGRPLGWADVTLPAAPVSLSEWIDTTARCLPLLLDVEGYAAPLVTGVDCARVLTHGALSPRVRVGGSLVGVSVEAGALAVTVEVVFTSGNADAAFVAEVTAELPGR